MLCFSKERVDKRFICHLVAPWKNLDVVHLALLPKPVQAESAFGCAARSISTPFEGLPVAVAAAETTVGRVQAKVPPRSLVPVGAEMEASEDTYPSSIRVNFFDMGIAYCSVSKTKNLNDSGVFLMQLLKGYDGISHFHFRPDHAKPIRESLTYYLVANKYNAKLNFLPEVKTILANHGICIFQ